MLKEEMRRVIAFLDWKAGWWIDRRGTRKDITNKDLLEGLSAYAEVQADLQRMLKEEFCSIWKLSLDDSTATHDDDNGADPSDSDDDGDDDDAGRFEDDDGAEGVLSDDDL